MDESVLAAIARWPNVPHVYGWLSLDRRGKWRLRGESISHPGANEFIGRNYERDARGAWYFQNGPQRVYVHLDYTPWVLHTGTEHTLLTHTGLPVQAVTAVMLDESGGLLIESEHGIGLVDDRDLAAVFDALCDKDGHAADEGRLNRFMAGETVTVRLHWGAIRLPLVMVRSDLVAERFGFIADPKPDPVG